MSTQFKPLLAAPLDFKHIEYDNLYASAKLDGVRCIVINGVLMSRSLKPIPNTHAQSLFSHLEFYDGELICGDPASPSVYRDTVSAVMSKDGEPNVRFYVFDHIREPDADYITRYEQLEESERVLVLPQVKIHDENDLLVMEREYLEAGYEGLMLRKGRGPSSKYKFGRATPKSGTLWKLKRFSDHEYEVIGFEERLHNANEAKVNELGYTSRSSHKENLVPMNTLGALILKHEAGEFRCGTGFTDADRQHIWDNRDMYLGSLAKIKHFEIGAKTLPRFPVWLGFRDRADM